jgi:ABC-type nitrate/sulfonate/bicarbonate transport system substrate-binding protein
MAQPVFCRLPRVALLSLVIVAAVACTPSASTGTAPAPGQPNAAPTMTPIKITVMELPATDDPTNSYNTLAQAFGSFQKYGLEVDIQHAAGGGPARIQQIVAGDIDLATTDIVSMYQGIHEGADVKAIIVPGAHYGSVLAADKSITKPEDLKGKQVATPSLAGAARFLAGQALQSFGVADADVQWLAIPSTSEEIQALAAGRVQGAVLSQTGVPAVNASVASGSNLHVLIESTAKYTPPWPNFPVIAKSDWVKKNPEAAKRYDLAMLDMMRQVANRENQQRFAEVGSKMYGEGLPVADAAKLWTRLDADTYWGVNGGVNYTVAQTVMDLVFQVRGFTANEHVSRSQDGFDTTALKAALDQLGLDSAAKDQPDWYQK